MKKTYIEPKNTVVALKVRDNVLVSGSGNGGQLFTSGGNTSSKSGIEADARETISAPNAWDEW